jgi:hypothetical protein
MDKTKTLESKTKAQYREGFDRFKKKTADVENSHRCNKKNPCFYSATKNIVTREQLIHWITQSTKPQLDSPAADNSRSNR